MIYLNAWPSFWLSASAMTGYYAVKSLRESLPKLLQFPFGKNSIVDRVDKAFKETLDGKLSVQTLVFGQEEKGERLYEFISGGALLARSLTLFVLSYFLYQESLREVKIDFQQLDECHGEIEHYNQELNATVQKFEYWRQEVCGWDQLQWERYTPMSEYCLNHASYTYSEIEDSCKQDFAELTFYSQFKDLSPKVEFNKAAKAQKEMQDKALGVCEGVLFRTESIVNEKCNYLYPYVGIHGKSICKFVQNAPFVEASKECLSACELHEQNYDDVYGKLEQEIPSTEGITVDCKEVLANPQTFPSELDPLSQVGISQQQIIEKIHSILDQVEGDWRNTSVVIPRKWRENPSHFRSISQSDLDQIPMNHHYMTVLRRALNDIRAKVDYTAFVRQFQKEFKPEELRLLEANKHILIR